LTAALVHDLKVEEVEANAFRSFVATPFGRSTRAR
jgi:hypothetical protein